MKFYLLLFSLCLIACQYPSEPPISLQDRAEEARRYCQANDFNEDFCILIDMNLHSGLDRFFVYDLKADSIFLQGLCAHGCGPHSWGADESKTKPLFSNVPESHCSSLGKYKMGARGVSSWGIKVNYKMHGLEESNSNAFKRFIVLHSWEAVPDNELFPAGTPEGWGCPAISNQLMREVDVLLQASTKPVLMWIYQ